MIWADLSPKAPAETTVLPNDARIALVYCRPETIGQDHHASGFCTVVLRADETAEDGAEATTSK